MVVCPLPSPLHHCVGKAWGLLCSRSLPVTVFPVSISLLTPFSEDYKNEKRFVSCIDRLHESKGGYPVQVQKGEVGKGTLEEVRVNDS